MAVDQILEQDVAALRGQLAGALEARNGREDAVDKVEVSENESAMGCKQVER
jgi:hypothetical protein